MGDISACHPLPRKIPLAGEDAVTHCVSPGDQTVKVGQAIGGGVEEHERVEGGCLLTRRQKQCFRGVEEDNLDNDHALE